MSRAQRFCAAVVVMVLASPALSRGAITWLTDTRTATLTHRTIQNNDSTFFDTLEFTASGPGDFSALNPSYTSSTLSHGSVAQNSSVTGGNHIFASGSFSSSDFLGNTTTQFDYGSSTLSFRFELTQSMIYTYTAAIGTTPTLARDGGPSILLQPTPPNTTGTGTLVPGFWTFSAAASRSASSGPVQFGSFQSFSADVLLTPAPEPGSCAGVCLAGLTLLHRRRRRNR